jgi:predicted SAM-dependent methyltransferase
MGRAAKAKRLAVVSMPVLRLDFGCGPNKRDGFEGVDRIAFPGVDHVLDIGTAAWPWKDGTVLEALASHFVEHLTATQRVHFCNELYRVLIPGGTCQIIVPHWASCRAYGDPTHQWPPVSEFWFYYLSKDWRGGNAPHTSKEHTPDGFACDFEATWGYSLHPSLHARSAEHQQFATANYKEACQDIVATLKKK